jgi:hypothetical protein
MIFCKNCKLQFIPDKKSRQFCSKKCAAEFRSSDLTYLTKLSIAAINSKGKRKKQSNESKKKIRESLLTYYSSTINKKEIKTAFHKGHIPWNKEKSLSSEHKRKLSSSNKGGRCKWYMVIKPNGESIKVQGSYELRFAKILNKIDETWIKPTIHNREHQFNWIDKNGKDHWYTPDFWSPKLQKYFEVKGFWPKSMEDKKEFVSSLKNVKIIYVKELLEYEG